MAQIQTADDIFGVSSYIVDPTAGQGTYTSIGAALTAASAASFTGDIFIRPGTYTENPALVAGVNLVAWDTDARGGTVIINGKCTFSSAGTVAIAGIELQTNSDYVLAVTGSAASIVILTNCVVNALNNTAIDFTSSSSSAQIRVYGGSWLIGTTGIALFTHSSAGQFQIINVVGSNIGGSTTANTVSAGSVIMYYTQLSNTTTISSAAVATLRYCMFDCGAINTTAMTFSSSTQGISFHNTFLGGTAAALTVTGTINCNGCDFNSSAANAVTGAGTFEYSLCTFSGSTSTINATTQTLNNTSAIQSRAVGIGASPGTTAGLTFDGSNYINNYVVGTFTPTMVGASSAGTTTYTTQQGYYVRIGAVVQVQAWVSGTAATGTGALNFGALPFTIKNQSNGNVPGSLYFSAGSWAWPASMTYLIPIGAPNATVLSVDGGGSSQVSGVLQMANETFQFIYNVTHEI